MAHGDNVLTGDSFFHLAGFGESLPGLNLCGAGRVVCLIDPVGDVYACPFAIHDQFLAGNLLTDGGFQQVWQNSPLFAELRSPQTGGACASCGHYDSCRGGCMAAKFFTGLPLDGPDPECVQGYGEQALAGARAPSRRRARTTPGPNPTRNQPVMLQLLTRRPAAAPPVSACAESPLAGFAPPVSCAGEAREPLEAEPLVRVGRRRPAARPQAPARARSTAPCVAGLRARPDGRATTRPRSPSSDSRRTSPGHQPKRPSRTTVLGQEISLPVVISPDRRPGRPSGRRGRGRPRGRGARDARWGCRTSPPSRSRRSTATGAQTFFQMYWTGDRDVMVQRMKRAHAAGVDRADRHPGLVVLDRARLGQPRDPGEGRPQDDGADGAEGDRQAALALPVRQDRPAPRPDRAQPRPAGRRMPRPSSAPTTSG